MYTKFTVNTIGLFSFKEPFDSLIPSDLELKVVSVNTIDGLNREGMDVFTLIYEPNALTFDDYESDMDLGVNILTLYDKVNQVNYYIPENYISIIPDNDYVKYINPIVCINLGLLPAKLNLESLKTDLTDHVTDLIGVDSNDVQIEIAGIDLETDITLDRHNELETIRMSNVKARPNLTLENAELKQKLIEKNKELLALQEILISYGLVEEG